MNNFRKLKLNKIKLSFIEKYKLNGGFSLIELVLAIIIIALAVIGPISLWVNLAGNNAHNKYTKQAIYLAHGVMEEFYVKSYEHVTGSCNSPGAGVDRIDYTGCSYASSSYTSTGDPFGQNVEEQEIHSLPNLVGETVNGYKDYNISTTSTNENEWTGHGVDTVPTSDLQILTVTITHDNVSPLTVAPAIYKLDMS